MACLIITKLQALDILLGGGLHKHGDQFRSVEHLIPVPHVDVHSIAQRVIM